VYQTIVLKHEWRLKCLERLRELMETPTFDKTRSMIGSLQYVRLFFGPSCPHLFFFWKAAARWATQPKKRLTFSPSVQQQLRDMIQFLETDPTRTLMETVEDETQILITDASKATPFAAWGAVLLDGERVSVTAGQFPLNTPDHISVLEMRAVDEAITHFATRLCRQHTSLTSLTILSDNTAVCYALNNMFSPHPTMHSVLVAIYNQLHSLARSPRVLFIPSAWNPADDPSRGKCLISEEKVTYARKIAMEYSSLRQSLGGCGRSCSTRAM